jgi:hypothetical protein
MSAIVANSNDVIMDEATFTRELNKYKVVRPSDYHKSRSHASDRLPLGATRPNTSSASSSGSASSGTAKQTDAKSVPSSSSTGNKAMSPQQQQPAAGAAQAATPGAATSTSTATSSTGASSSGAGASSSGARSNTSAAAPASAGDFLSALTAGAKGILTSADLEKLVQQLAEVRFQYV